MYTCYAIPSATGILFGRKLEMSLAHTNVINIMNMIDLFSVIPALFFLMKDFDVNVK